MGERRGTKALELWCRRVTEGYPGVNVQNMTTSWKDGLAFCAMIHRFRPDLIDFNSLNRDDVYENNQLAFKTAEDYLGIPALLDAQDMASMAVPDRLSILTYLSQFYKIFGGSSPKCRALNETTEIIDENINEMSESPPKKVESCSGMRRDKCAACSLPVFLAEKLVIAHVVYHRTCFRCARCSNQLTPGNYYETEEGQYCCETCPDEASPSPSVLESDNAASLSDVSGTTVREDTITECQEPSGKETNTEEASPDHNSIKPFQQRDFPIPDLIAQTSQLRLSFMSNHLLSEESEKVSNIDDSVTNADSNNVDEDSTVNSERETVDEIRTTISDDDKSVKQVENEGNSFSNDSSKHNTPIRQKITGKVVEDAESAVDYRHEVFKNLEKDEKLSTNSQVDAFKDDSSRLISKTDDTKERLLQSDRADSARPLSLVQQRLNMFESQNVKKQIKRKDDEHRNADTLKLDARDSVQAVDEKPTESLTSDLESVKNQTLDDEAMQSVSTDVSSSVECASTTNKMSPSEAVNQTNSEDTNSSIDEDYPEDLNPFKSDEEDNISEKFQAILDSYENEGIDVNEGKRKDEKNAVTPKAAVRSSVRNDKVSQVVTEMPVKRRLPAPKISLNPFLSDDDDYDDELESKGKTFESTPVPKPRINKRILDMERNGQTLDLSSSDLYTSNSSLTNLELGAGAESSYRKKKPAPPPPIVKDLNSSDDYMIPAHDSPNKSAIYHDISPRTTPRARKMKPAPPPPMPTSTPRSAIEGATLNFEESSIMELDDTSKSLSLWEDQKTNKEEANKNRKSLTHFSGEETYDHKSYIDKSTQGKWKRKKGPAPACPIPHRRKIKVMSLKDVKLELEEIEMQQQGLERQGVRLEQLIRSKYETGENNEDGPHGTDVEELVLELFSLVNEKNELFRRQAELMLLRRQHRLEEEHADVEYQIRCLMSKHKSTKTDFDKQREEVLIQRLVEIVERRNEIVECLEMDRRREIEEDRSIHKHLGIFAAKNKTEISNNDIDDRCNTNTKKSKAKGKTKEKKSKRLFKKDIDKDIDETELKHKRHNKRKWF